MLHDVKPKSRGIILNEGIDRKLPSICHLPLLRSDGPLTWTLMVCSPSSTLSRRTSFAVAAPLLATALLAPAIGLPHYPLLLQTLVNPQTCLDKKPAYSA